MFQTPAAPPPLPRRNRTIDRLSRRERQQALSSEPPSSGPGEFTRMFQTPAASPPPPVPHRLPLHRAPPASEFTRMFQTPAAHLRRPQSNDRPFITPERKPVPPAEPPPSGPGEFTRMFQTPAASPPPPTQPPPPSSAPPAGEFTRMFQTPAASPTPPPPPPAAPQAKAAEPGEFTRFFQAPQQASSTPAAHPAYKDPFAKAQEPAAPASGVGEFTRMFGTPVVSANPMPHAQPPSAAFPQHRAAPTTTAATRPWRVHADVRHSGTACARSATGATCCARSSAATRRGCAAAGLRKSPATSLYLSGWEFCC